MSSKVRRVCVLGLGYVGLPTAAVLANRGLEVVGVDVREDVVEKLNKGSIHIEEPGLDVAVRAAVALGKFTAYTAPRAADAFIIAVPTPFKENRQPELKFVEAAAESICAVIQRGGLVILESTSPPGTTQRVAEIIQAKTGLRSGIDFFAAHCPERVLPGRTMEELISNDRVIGGLNSEGGERARQLYSLFVQGRILLTDARTAEIVKLMENTYRDVNVALANEFSMICDKLDINVWQAIALANRHPRVNILSPGPGVGGHCIPVDPWFLASSAPAEAQLIPVARAVNENKAAHVERQILCAAAKAGALGVRQVRGDGDGEVLMLGLSYKADVDDFRESPALEIAARVTHKLGSIAAVHDPYIDGCHIEELHRVHNLESAIARAKVVALLTDHKVYRELNQRVLIGKAVIDTRGIWTARTE